MKVNKLDGSWIVVTGAGAGIGRAIALDAAQRGGNVAICDIDPERLEETAALLAGYEVDVVSSVVDVVKRDQVEAFADLVHERATAVDILVNNAGVALAADILETSAEDWQFIIGVNLMGVIHFCDAFCPEMIERDRGGHVVNIASMEGFAALEGFGAYSTTKFAVVGYSDSLRQELSHHDIGVSVVCPGVVRTSLTANMRSRGEYEAGIADRIHQQHEKSKFGPEKVAKAVFSAVRFNTPLRPVAPESWMTYYSNRLSPRLTSFILKHVALRVLRNGAQNCSNSTAGLPW
jgi:NAD(P)-dependent dehydrogenase (short-subunit alcohol dehydrogenase family)